MSVRTLDVPGHRAILGAGVYYGAAMSEARALPRPERRHRRRRELRGSGRAVLLPLRAQGHDAVRAAGLSPAMSRYLVDRIDDTPNIEVVARVGGRRRGRRHASRTDRAQEHRHGRAHDPRHGRDVHLHRRGARTDRASQAWWRWTTRASSSPALPCRAGARLAARSRPADVRDEHPRCLRRRRRASGANRRVAAAVGEGSAAIYSVHRYLETV